MYKSITRRILAILMVAVLITVLLPMAGAAKTVWAVTYNSEITQGKTIVCVGTDGIKAPSVPEHDNDRWTGSYVWFGKYNGDPVRYRVLAPKTTIYGSATMLLDCDTVLFPAPFDSDGVANLNANYPNEWMHSDLWDILNGMAFLDAGGFNAREQEAIAKSYIAPHALVEGTDPGCVCSFVENFYKDYVGLNGEQIFLLDVEDVSNPAYGYATNRGNVIGRDKGSIYQWWLRSASANYTKNVGSVDSYGWIEETPVTNEEGVSPAFNIALNSVIFTSLVSGTAGQDDAEYKLTIRDKYMVMSMSGSGVASYDGNAIAIPYHIGGALGSRATQVSVLVLDKEYTEGNANGASVLYYGNLQTGGVLNQDGTGTFVLPYTLSVSDWGNAYHVYILSEVVKGKYETDLASKPLEIGKPVPSDQPIIPEQPVISSQPKNTSVACGNTAKFTVTASGNGTLKYQWQSRKNANSAWTNSGQTGAKTATLSVNTKESLNGWQFRCIVTDSLGETASTPATLSILPKITTQPANVTANPGDTVTFRVNVTGVSPFKYQWQSRKDANSTWSNSGQTGAKTLKLEVNTTAGLHGWQFRCVITDAKGNTVNSNPATLKLVPKITTQPKDAFANPGTKATFTVAATGKANLSYQWQSRKDSSSEWSNSGQTGAKTAKLQVNATAGLNGWQFRCVVTDGNGQKSASQAATLKTKLTITYQPKSISVAAGQVARFTTLAVGTGRKYQWQSRKDANSAWTNSGQTGAKAATLEVNTTAGLHNWQFRCIVTDDQGSTVISNTATLTIIPKITTQPRTNVAPAGTTAKFTIAATGKGTLKYQWQSRKDANSNWSNSGQTGAKTTTLSVATTNGLDGWQFRCIVTDANGSSVESDIVHLSIIDLPIISEYFPCDEFREYVSYHFDTDKNGSLSREEIASVTEIRYYGYSGLDSVTSLKGIEFFTSLERLTLDDFSLLTSLDLSKNQALTSLSISDTALKSLILGNNPKLTYIYCSRNQLTTLDVSGLANLKTIYCSNNSLTKLNVSKNKELENLFCSGNSLSTLDVSNNTKLRWLDVSGNTLTKIDVTKCTSLYALFCNKDVSIIGAGSEVKINDYSLYV
ncbi:MAG: leucine-rich repeat domain-containing protein [Lachnospiraceae bacterium]|nr:leucine-rich repeat domain-containing protein [Lachnospiraceae bacterium]